MYKHKYVVYRSKTYCLQHNSWKSTHHLAYLINEYAQKELKFKPENVDVVILTRPWTAVDSKNKKLALKVVKSLPKTKFLVFDHASEGTRSSTICENWYRFVRANLPIYTKFFIVSQNVCLHKLVEKNTVNCRYFNNYWNSMQKTPTKKTLNNFNSGKRFLVLGGCPRPHKQLLMSALLKNDILDSCVTEFSFGDIRNSRWNTIQQLPKYGNDAEMANLIKNWWPELVSMTPKMLGKIKPEDKSKTMVYDSQLYDLGQFHIVIETEFDEDGSKDVKRTRYTEKILKCIVSKKPFVVFGNCGTLALLRKDGFRTFGNYIDESYDSEHEPMKRMQALLRVVSRLRHMTDTQFEIFMKSMNTTVDYNYTLLKNELWLRRKLHKLLNTIN